MSLRASAPHGISSFLQLVRVRERRLGRSCKDSKSFHTWASLQATLSNTRRLWAEEVVLERTGGGWGWLWWAFLIVARAPWWTGWSPPLSVHTLPGTTQLCKTVEQFWQPMMSRLVPLFSLMRLLIDQVEFCDTPGVVSQEMVEKFKLKSEVVVGGLIQFIFAHLLPA